MIRLRVLLLVGAVVCLGIATGAIAKEKTAEVDGEVLTDKIYEYTFTKNENWKFKVLKEEPEEPRFLRFEFTKAAYQMPPKRAFSPETWTVTFGGFFVDTTSLTAQQFADEVVQGEWNEDQRKAIAKKFDLLRDGELNEVLDVQIGALGMGLCMTYSEEYDVQIRDRLGDYDVITDRLIGDLYFTVFGGRVYGLYFVSERADYRLCRTDIRRMIDSISFVKEETAADSTIVDSVAVDTAGVDSAAVDSAATKTSSSESTEEDEQ